MNEKKDGAEFKTLDASVTEKKGKLDPADEEVIRQASEGDGLIKIDSIEDFQDLVESANRTYNTFKERIADMTEKEAAEVRRVRIDEGFSWRAVARHFHDLGDFGEFDPPSNQLAGMALCERAAEIYGEDYMSPPWNG